jgi:hypothetical protein
MAARSWVRRIELSGLVFSTMTKKTIKNTSNRECTATRETNAQRWHNTVPESGLHSFWDRRNERNLLATMKNGHAGMNTRGAQTQWKHAAFSSRKEEN